MEKAALAAQARAEGPKTVLSREACTGANYLKTGEDPVLKEDAAYPDWLWKLAEPKKQTSELLPDSQQHWRRNRKALARERNATSVLLR